MTLTTSPPKSLPNVIIFYGPPGSGKGTQASLLQERFNLEFLDWGHEFRQYISNYAEDDNHPNSERAQRIQKYIQAGQPILTEDMQAVIGPAITEGCLIHKKAFVMDKPGSLPAEAEWVASLLQSNQIPSCLIHLVLDKQTSLDRIESRYYVPNDKFPFESYEQALEHCPPGVLPIQRKEDQSREISSKRYQNLYGTYHQIILDIYRAKHHTKMTEVNASLSITEVHQQVIQFLSQTNF